MNTRQFRLTMGATALVGLALSTAVHAEAVTRTYGMTPGGRMVVAQSTMSGGTTVPGGTGGTVQDQQSVTSSHTTVTRRIGDSPVQSRTSNQGSYGTQSATEPQSMQQGSPQPWQYPENIGHFGDEAVERQGGLSTGFSNQEGPQTGSTRKQERVYSPQSRPGTQPQGTATE